MDCRTLRKSVAPRIRTTTGAPRTLIAFEESNTLIAEVDLGNLCVRLQFVFSMIPSPKVTNALLCSLWRVWKPASIPFINNECELLAATLPLDRRGGKVLLVMKFSRRWKSRIRVENRQISEPVCEDGITGICEVWGDVLAWHHNRESCGTEGILSKSKSNFCKSLLKEMFSKAREATRNTRSFASLTIVW